MKKHLILISLSLCLSLSAQNFIINGKFSKPFNENFERAIVLETLIATNDNAYSIGVFFGLAKVDFNFASYDWSAMYEDTNTKVTSGFITYIYPLNNAKTNFLRPIYFSLTWSHISDYGFIQGGGYMFSEPGYAYPGSKNENSWIITSGYKIQLESITVLLGLGYQYREYDLTFKEFDDEYYSYFRSIHQIEKFFQIDIGLQFVF